MVPKIYMNLSALGCLGTGHKVQGGGLAEIGGGSSIFKLMKRGGSPKYWSCL